jgi:hypothetical protein
MTTQQDNNYVIGRGRIYFAPYLPETTTPGAEGYFGNTPSLEVTQANTDLKHYSSEEGLKIQDMAVTLQKDITVQFGCDNISLPNLAQWFGADTSVVDQIATVGAAITENFTVVAGGFYQIGATDANPLGISNLDPLNFTAVAVEETYGTGTLTFAAQPAANDTVTINGVVITFVAAAPAGAQVQIGGNFAGTAQNLAAYINANPDTLDVGSTGSNAVLTLTALEPGAGGNAITIAQSGANPAVSGATLAGGGAGASGPLTQGTDWNIDPEGGRFQILEGGGVADNSVVTVSYKTLSASTDFFITNEEDIYGALRFIADNPVGANVDYYWPFVLLRSNGNFNLKGDTWQEMTFMAEVLKKDGFQRQYARQRPGTGNDGAI